MQGYLEETRQELRLRNYSFAMHLLENGVIESTLDNL